MTRNGAAIQAVLVIAISVIITVVGILLVDAHERSECQERGGVAESVGRGYICVAPDGRLIP